MASDRPSWVQAIGYVRLTAFVLLSLLVLTVLAAWADSHHGRERKCPVSDPEVCNFMMGSYWQPLETGRAWEWMWASPNLNVLTLRTDRGILSLTVARSDAQPMTQAPFDRGAVGFAWRRYSGPQSLHERDGVTIITSYWHVHEMILPMWALLMITALPMTIILRRCRRTIRWLRTGRCLRCGYDLTGNTSGVCPECGVRARLMPGENNEKPYSAA